MGTSNVSVPLLPDGSVKLTSKALQLAPFHPSPKLSDRLRMQVAPAATSKMTCDGAPPDMVVLSEQLTLQLISEGQLPAVTVMGVPASGDGDCGDCDSSRLRLPSFWAATPRKP